MRDIGTRTDYLRELRKRSKQSRVYRDYQLVGLELAEILSDRDHVSLYIKLAKTKDQGALLGLARDIAERKNVKKPGAYFMRRLSQTPMHTKQRKP